MKELIEKIRLLTIEQLKDPAQSKYTLLAHTLEELGELSTALCVEDNDSTKKGKEVDEKAWQEAVDVIICAYSLFYCVNGKTEDLSDYMAKKLDKWESKVLE